MLRLATDADVHGDIIRGLRRRPPELDLIRVQDVNFRQADDTLILAWAADESRVLITGDRKTMIGFAWDRVKHGLPMPGIFVLRSQIEIGQVVDDLSLAAECYDHIECENLVQFFPL